MVSKQGHHRWKINKTISGVNWSRNKKHKPINDQELVQSETNTAPKPKWKRTEIKIDKFHRVREVTHVKSFSTEGGHTIILTKLNPTNASQEQTSKTKQKLRVLRQNYNQERSVINYWEASLFCLGAECG